MMYKIVRSNHGYYTLFVNGVFEGNYDTPSEAAHAYDEIVSEKSRDNFGS